MNDFFSLIVYEGLKDDKNKSLDKQLEDLEKAAIKALGITKGAAITSDQQEQIDAWVDKRIGRRLKLAVSNGMVGNIQLG